MHLSQYQILAMRTRGIYQGRKLTPMEEQLMAGAFGLCGESGEFIDALKKFFFHNKPIPDETLLKEIGDVLWYIALICDAKGWNMDTVAGKNIEKLMARYPEGFSFEAANNRKEDSVKS